MASDDLGAAEIELLSLYKKPRYLDHPNWQDLWAQKLRRGYMETIDRFVKDGFLTDCVSDFDTMHYGPQSAVPNLKAILKSEGLPTNGTKDDLIRRILEQRPDRANEILATCLKLYVCTTKGKAAIEPLIGRVHGDNAQRADAAARASELLRDGDVEKAVAVFDEYRQSAYSMDFDRSEDDMSADVRDSIERDMAAVDARERETKIRQVKRMIGIARPVPDSLVMMAASLLGIGDIRAASDKMADKAHRESAIQQAKALAQAPRPVTKPEKGISRGREQRDLQQEYVNLSRQRETYPFGTPEFETLSKAMQRASKRKDALWRLDFTESQRAHALEMTGNVEEALAVYETLIAEECSIPAVYGWARVLYSKMSRNMDALRICERYIALANPSPDSEWYVRRDNLKKRLGK